MSLFLTLRQRWDVPIKSCGPSLAQDIHSASIASVPGSVLSNSLRNSVLQVHGRLPSPRTAQSLLPQDGSRENPSNGPVAGGVSSYFLP